MVETFQGRTYEHDTDGEYYLKSGAKKYHLVKNNVIVKFKNKIQLNDISASKYSLPSLKRIMKIAEGEFELIEIPDGYDLLDALSKLQSTNAFEVVEPNAYAEYSSGPNDYYYANGYQWNLAKIEMPKAWDITTGSSDIKVAVIGGELIIIMRI